MRRPSFAQSCIGSAASETITSSTSHPRQIEAAQHALHARLQRFLRLAARIVHCRHHQVFQQLHIRLRAAQPNHRCGIDAHFQQLLLAVHRRGHCAAAAGALHHSLVQLALYFFLHLSGLGHHLRNLQRIEQSVPPPVKRVRRYLMRRSTTLRISALKISLARCTNGFASAASCTLPASGAATSACPCPDPSPGTTRKRAGPPSRCSSCRMIFSAAAFTVRLSIFLPMPATSMRRLETSSVQVPEPSSCDAD